MAPTISNSYGFNLPVDELLEMALEPLGGEFVNYKEARMARMVLNLLLIDLQNRGMAPLASLREVTLPLTAGTGTYTLPSYVFNVMDCVITVTDSNGKSTDLSLNKISLDQWMMMPNKEQEGRPSQVLVNRQRDAVELRFWQIPDDKQTYTFKGWCLHKIADVTGSYQLLDVPQRYLPAIKNGLTFFMSMDRRAPMAERDWYKMQYMEQLDLALGEDRERVDFILYPAKNNQLRR